MKKEVIVIAGVELRPEDALRIVLLPEACHIVGRSPSTLRRDVKAGRLPPPMHIGPRLKGWRFIDLVRPNLSND